MPAETAVLRIRIDPGGSVTVLKDTETGLDRTASAASKLDSKILGMVGGVVSAAAAFAAVNAAIRMTTQYIMESVKAASDQESVMAQVEAAVRATGGAAGFTTAQLSDMASGLEAVSRFSDDAIMDMQSLLLSFKSIRGDQFREASAAVLDLAVRMKTDLRGAAMQLAKALEDPDRGLTMLRRSGIVLATSQEELIKKMAKSGDVVGAQTKLLDELGKRYGGAALADLRTYAGATEALKNQHNNLQEVIGGSVLPMLTNFKVQLTALVVGNKEGAAAVAEFARQAMQFALAGGAVILMAAEWTLSVGSRLVNAHAALAEVLASLTVGDTSDWFKEAAANARENAAEMEKLAGLMDKGADAFIKAAFGIGEVKNQAAATVDPMTGLGEAIGMTAEETKAWQERLDALTAKFDPVGAQIKSLEKDYNDLLIALEKHPEQARQWILMMDGIIKQIKTLRGELVLAANYDIEMLPVKGSGERLKEYTVAIKAKVENDGDVDLSVVEDEFADINAQFSADLQQGVDQAFQAGLIAFANGSDDAIEKFGESLIAVLLKAVAQWLAAQLMATKQAAAAAKTIQAGDSTGGGMSTAGIVGIFIGAAVAMKQFADASNAKKDQEFNQHEGYYQVGYAGGQASSSRHWIDDAMEAGNENIRRAADEMFETLMESVMAGFGGLISGVEGVGVAIRHDGEQFQAMFGETVVGVFDTAEEALIAGIQEAFKAGTWTGTLDPILAQVVANFSGPKDQIFAALDEVRSIMDQAAGLSETEVQIRDLPATLAKLEAHLVSLGVSAEDAAILAAKAGATQLQNIRDQITGHQQSAAEQRAQKEREALMFNAQLALDQAKIEAEKANLRNQIAIETAKVQVMNEGAQASIDILNAQLAAYEQISLIMAAIKPIDLKEIKLPKAGGSSAGTGGSGPSAADQQAALNEELDRLANSLLPQWQQRMAEINATYQDQVARATELGMPLDRINQLYREQQDALAEDALESLGLASVATQRELEDLADTLEFLRAQGGITEDQLEELSNTMFLRLGDWLMQWIDDEEMKRALEVLRFQMELANFRLQFELLKAAGALTEAQIALINKALYEVLTGAREGGGIPGGRDAERDAEAEREAEREARRQAERDRGRDRRRQAEEDRRRRLEEARRRAEERLTDALDRLRGAMEQMQDVRDSFKTGELSPLTLDAQMRNAQAAYESTLAKARAGDITAIEQVADAARLYAQLAGQVLDPSSSAYAQIVAALDAQLGGLQGGIQGVLNAAPNVNEGVEDRLDTIAEVLNQIRLLGGGSATWRPGSVGTLPPRPGGGGTPQNDWIKNLGGVTVGSGPKKDAHGNLVVTSPQLDEVAAELVKQRLEIARLREESKKQTTQQRQIAMMKRPVPTLSSSASGVAERKS